MGCAESTIRTNAKKGTLGFTAVKVGSLWKFRDEDVYEYVYGKNWKAVVFGIVGEPDRPEARVSIDEARTALGMDDEPALEQEPQPAPMSARPTNIIPLGAQEVKFEE